MNCIPLFLALMDQNQHNTEEFFSCVSRVVALHLFPGIFHITVVSVAFAMSYKCRECVKITNLMANKWCRPSAFFVSCERWFPLDCRQHIGNNMSEIAQQLWLGNLFLRIPTHAPQPGHSPYHSYPACQILSWRILIAAAFTSVCLQLEGFFQVLYFVPNKIFKSMDSSADTRVPWRTDTHNDWWCVYFGLDCCSNAHMKASKA